MSDLNFDIAVIGGGASGLCFAVRSKQLYEKYSVAVIEQLQRVGKKLITTGNGRCNITNKDISLSRYHSDNITFAEYALKNYNNCVAEEFFRGIGIDFVYDETGRAYPYSLQASSVVDGLRFSCEHLGVDTFTEQKVLSITPTKNGYLIKTSKEQFTAKCVVLASGLYSGGEKSGCNGSILRMLKDMGYNTVKVSPAIVQIHTKTETVRQLKGIKVNANATLKQNGKSLRSEYGEVLFCDYGLSGPPILQISRAIGRENAKFTVSLDLMPDYDFNTLLGILKNRVKILNYRTLDEFFTGMLNKRLGQVIIKNIGKKLNDSVSTLTDSDTKVLISQIKNFEFEVTGLGSFESSQVTAGGLDTDAFDKKTMMSKKDKGLFAIGEILDVDGDCGGFNLQWAWSSSMCAADGVAKYLGGEK